MPKQLLFFIGFWAITLVAIYFARHPRVRSGYLVLFFTILILPGLAGDYYWPFFDWHLFSFRAPTAWTFYEMRIVDTNDVELKYDARASAPTLATPIRRYAKRFPTLPPSEQEEFTKFLLENANEYREKIQTDSFSPILLAKFPPHQIGFKWSQALLLDVAQFDELRVYQIEIELSEDGRDILHRSEQLIGSYR